MIEQLMSIHNFEEKIIATIGRSSTQEFDCLHQGKWIKARATNELLKRTPLVVGDQVVIQYHPSSQQYRIVELLPRKNEIFRHIVRNRQKKIIASNVECFLIVCSVSFPQYKPFLLDRYLLRAIQWNIPPLVIFNKMDEFENQFDLNFEQEKLKLLEVPCYTISNLPEDKHWENLIPLRNLIANHTVICVGQSGVGKSKLISSLSEGDVELLSGDLAKGVSKGAHTTTWAELINCKKFQIIDSPGIRSLAINDVPLDELPSLFPDLVDYFSQCQFSNCAHSENSKGCVFSTLDPQLLETKILQQRLKSYCKIRDEINGKIPEYRM